MGKIYFLLLASFCISFTRACLFSKPKAKEDDLHLTMVERLAKFGYPSEVHYVKTKDGYILKVYRVTHGPKCKSKNSTGTPVLLVHGIFSSSLDYISASTENSLGYQLPDACMDTWILNSRGNFESTNHTHLSTWSKKYWDFDWHEMGKYDIPAVIHYIVKNTRSWQVNCIGHSQGSTQFFIYLSLYPGQSSRMVKSFHALAPVAYLPLSQTPIFLFLAKHITFLKGLLDFLHIYQIPKLKLIEKVAKAICLKSDRKDINGLCRYVSYRVFGYDNRAMNASLWDMFLTVEPAGIAVKQLAHFAQEAKAGGKFQQYDYGPMKNMLKYGSLKPPEYNISKIQVPIYLHYSSEDHMSEESSVLKFAKMAKTAHLNKVDGKFGHMVYLYGNDLGYFNKGLIEQLKRS